VELINVCVGPNIVILLFSDKSDEIFCNIFFFIRHNFSAVRFARFAFEFVVDDFRVKTVLVINSISVYNSIHVIYIYFFLLDETGFNNTGF